MSNNENDRENDRVRLPQIVRELRENILAHIELVELDARIKRKKFLALVANGFSEQQALDLCK